MDLEEWEFVPDDGFLEIHDDGGKKFFSRKYGIGRATSPKNVFNTDYFRCPSPRSTKFVDSTEESVLIPLQIQLDDPIVDHPEVVVKEITTKIPLVIPEAAAAAPTAELDPVFQVFFKKMKENEFVDMKMDSPKSGSRGILPQIEAGTFQFEEESDDGEAMEGKINNNNNSAAKAMAEKEEEVITFGESNDEGINLWKGVGAICSFGMAAATICIIIFGNAQRNKHNQKLRFQIYSDDKRIKQVVQQATKLNEAISSAVRGVPLNRAHITTGGYYDGI